jgi:nucleoid-associated protein YgaU
LSDLAWANATNGWGPVEKDTSVGGDSAGDGKPITLNGSVYAKGLGTNAWSEIRYALGGACRTFVSDIGVDDDVNENGSVVFQVFIDGVQRYTSQPMTGATPTAHVTVDLTGGKELRLVVTDGGDGDASDHGDWAGAQVLCGSAEATPLPIAGPPPSTPSAAAEPGAQQAAAQQTPAPAAAPPAPPASEPAPAEGADPAPAAGERTDAMITIDSPVPGGEIPNDQLITISGWALDPGGPGPGVTGVDLFLDELSPDGLIGTADYGAPRPDIAEVYGQPQYANSGFTYAWDPTGVASGPHTLYAVAYSVRGSWIVGSLDVDATPQQLANDQPAAE